MFPFSHLVPLGSSPSRSINQSSHLKPWAPSEQQLVTKETPCPGSACLPPSPTMRWEHPVRSNCHLEKRQPSQVGSCLWFSLSSETALSGCVGEADVKLMSTNICGCRRETCSGSQHCQNVDLVRQRHERWRRGELLIRVFKIMKCHFVIA